MEPTLFLRGLVYGFGIATVVGPITLLVIRRTLTSGLPIGLASGLGVATADATYGAVAAFGLAVVSQFLVSWRVPLALIGGGVLVFLGIRALLARPATTAAADPATRRGLASAYASILGLTLTNPMTILSFAAVFAALGVAGSGVLGAGTVVLGVFAGSALWWLILTPTVSSLRGRVTPRVLRAVNIGSGVLIAGFGIVTIAGILPR